MLLVVTVETNRKRPNDVGSRLIQAEYWHAATTVETTKAQFEYPLNYRDRRDSTSLLKTTEGVAAIRVAATLAPTTEYIILPVHPEDNVALATIDYDFRTRDVVWGQPYGPDPNKSWVFILKGAFAVERYLVDETLAGIVALVT